jgi:UDP-N-acetylmuramate dehydrogenase
MLRRNFPLKNYNTFGLDYKASYFISLKTEDDIKRFQDEKTLIYKPVLILGGGSNILFTGDFEGLIVHPETEGISIEEADNEYVTVSARAGTNWDKLVEWSVEKGFSGLENLSLIPGNVGATPVQNIGAYGREVKEFIVKVAAINIRDGSERIFTNDECRFGYRESFFKTEGKGSFMIIKVYYKLNINHSYTLNYGSLEEEVKKSGRVTLKNVRKAVINIRQSKLPDPRIIGNAGSFFKNPVVDKNIEAGLKSKYPHIPFYNDPSGKIKLPAGWLIDQCGWKGRRIGDAGVHESQALVLVNYGNATGKQIYDLSEIVKKSVFEKFGIELEREVEVVGSI